MFIDAIEAFSKAVSIVLSIKYFNCKASYPIKIYASIRGKKKKLFVYYNSTINSISQYHVHSKELTGKL